MTILFLHGWQSNSGGVKPTYLAQHGHEVINPKLPDEDFTLAVQVAQEEFDKHQPQVAVGSSRGGAVAMNIKSGSAKLVLLCPAWKKWGTARTVKPGTVILQSRADDVIPFADSEELAKNSGATLIEVGTDHRLADQEPLEAMLRACGGELAMSQPEVIEIELPICHNATGRPGTEAVDVERLGPKQFRLLFSPGVVEGLAKGDVFELSDTDPKGFTVVTRSGNLCVWFYFQEPGVNQGPDGNRVRVAVEKLGGICDGGGNINLVFSVPVSIGFPAIEALFNDLVKQYPGSSWLFGNVFDPWNDFKPLRWWENLI